MDMSSREEVGVGEGSGSNIEIEEYADGVTIRIGPAGVWKGSRGMLSFAILWCGFMLVIDVVAVGAMIKEGGRKLDGIWILIAVSTLFWLVGVLMFLAAINMGRRKGAIAVAGGQLMVIQTGIFGSKKREWALEEVKSVRAGPSGMEINHRPVLELQIVGEDGEKFGMLCGRSDEELRNLARLVRRNLKLAGREEESVQGTEQEG